MLNDVTRIFFFGSDCSLISYENKISVGIRMLLPLIIEKSMDHDDSPCRQKIFDFDTTLNHILSEEIHYISFEPEISSFVDVVCMYLK